MMNQFSLAPYETVIWDWNGTLVNDLEASIYAMNQLLLARKMQTITSERYRAVFGFPVSRFYEALGFNLVTEDWDQVSIDFHYHLFDYGPLQLHDFAHLQMAQIHRMGKRQVILSALEQSYLDQSVDRLGVRSFFQAVQGAGNLHGESKIEAGKRLLARFAIEPERTVLIGDTLHDFEVAQALGVHPLLISAGHQSYDRLALAQVPVIRSLEFMIS